jgi:hypothetical protein
MADLRDKIAKSSASNSSISIAQVAIELQLPPNAIAPHTNPVDLIQQTLNLRFSEAVQWASSRFGDSATVRLFDVQTKQVVTEQLVQTFTPPAPAENVWESARNWLSKTQSIPLSLVDRLHEEGVLYASERGLVFLQRHLEGGVTGAMEIDRQGDLEWKIADGSSRTNGWYYFESVSGTTVERVVITDNPLESIAYATLHRSNQPTLYLATNDGGWIPDLPTEVEVTIATDRRLANLPVRCKTQQPASDSWRDDLAAYLDRIMEDAVVEVTVKQQHLNPQTFPQSEGYSRGR